MTDLLDALESDLPDVVALDVETEVETDDVEPEVETEVESEDAVEADPPFMSVDTSPPDPFVEEDDGSTAFNSHFASFEAQAEEDEADVDDVEAVEEPGARRGRPPKEMSVAKAAQRAEYADMVEGLDFHTGGFSVAVHRVEPDETEDGENCGGFLKTFKRAVTLEEVQRVYGGGKFRFIIKGPSADGRRKNLVRDQTTQVIGGPARMPTTRAQREREDMKVEASKQAALQQVLDSKDAADERHRQDSQALRDKADSQNNVLLNALLNKKDDMTPILTMMQTQNADRAAAEDRRRDAETAQRREDKEAAALVRKEEKEVEDKKEEKAEQRRREDREERIRRDDLAREERNKLEAAAREERKDERLADQQKHEAAIAKQTADAKIAADANANMMTMMAAMMTSMGDKNGTSATEAMKIQANQQKAMLDMQTANTSNLMLALKDNSGKKDSAAEMIATFSSLQQLINPQEVDTRTTAERIISQVGEMVPGVVGGLAGLAQQRAAAVQQEQPSPQLGPRPVQQPPPDISIGVVDDIDAHIATAKELPPTTKETTGEPPDEEPIDMTTVKNPMTEFPPKPFENLSTVEQGTAVIFQMIDLGIQQELDVGNLYSRIFDTLPTMQKAMLTAVPVDLIHEQIKMNLPTHWEIRTAAGEEMVNALFDKLKEA